MKSRFIRQVSIASLLASAMMLLSQGAANASTCIEQVHELADRYHVTTKPPKADAETGLSTNKLSQSGGVVTPPPVADNSVITPAQPPKDRMPTLPDVTASTPEPPKAKAAEQASLQALLMAAREQAEQGREAQCLDRLHEAQQLLNRPK
ncbi:MAG: hypothetical protein JOY64_37050 [Alphaproteobacteria bacterium]|nr:hypothetical protein [Alphaproteobacteria bacterium]MBV8413280.1 hypothetical protein [Alphaproteobacteria bacterium]